MIRLNGRRMKHNPLQVERLKNREHKQSGKFSIYSKLAGLLFLVTAGVVFILTRLPLNDGQWVRVSFTLDEPEARTVNLVGDFNQWNPTATTMLKNDGLWQTQLRLQKGHMYTYKFFIDQEHWITDPKSLNNIEDGFGSENSTIVIE